MLHHSFSRSTFSISTMIPIPKGLTNIYLNLKTVDGLLWVSKKYLISVLYHDCEGVALTLDGLQFDYTSGMSTIQCAYVVSKTLNYY